MSHNTDASSLPEGADRPLSSIQPGGGAVMRLELAWGYLRRLYLWTFRRSYVDRMLRLRKGTANQCPHPVLDPRDLKFYRNRPGYWWDPRDDPFAWRDNLPFARPGLAELLLFAGLLFGMAKLLLYILFAWQPAGWWRVFFGLDIVVLLVLGGLIVWFFRNPKRRIPTDPQVVVAPADGLIDSIQEIDDDAFIGEPAVRISIFLSIFNVHINRVPVSCRVVGLKHRRGRFLDARNPESSTQNEQLAIYLEQAGDVRRRMIVRQITGLIARRIVCWLKLQEELSIGQQLGMIKFGSRTELVLPRRGLELDVQVGQSVQAGSSVLGRYEPKRSS
ncbi:MAG: phosphatidylserine decarboxylase family protein [Planctomycetaceae bacterium]|nr:phosphatidylserine decarboxylase family protein [Planctomycetaceae bacterium]